MKQPDLGKKISQLRKEKGLTQEELVGKCEISIRTLQRIESGEATPRSYTLKTILLQLESENSLKVECQKIDKLTWLEQITRYVFDLFNLKTKTMKKILILTIVFSGIFLVSAAVTNEKDRNSLKDKNKEIVFSNFYCDNCFEEDHDLIGHGVSFKLNGVTMKMDLIKVNKLTREFSCGYIKGTLLENKVELTCPKDLANDESVNLLAEDVNKLEDKIILKGKASISSGDMVLIEAEEIVIFFE